MQLSDHIDGLFFKDIELVPGWKGAYLLVFELHQGKILDIGKLGRHLFDTGIYGYAGSAYGSGGLAARLKTHFRQSVRRHWHIDSFYKEATCVGVWVFRLGRECDVVETLLTIPDSIYQTHGFGSSDCRNCKSHLIRLPSS